MDFHTLPRRDLQALCKKNRIPANLTNAAMADALGALPTVEGMDEPSQFQSPQKPEILSPDLPRTGRRTAARKAAPAPVPVPALAPTPPPVAPEEPKEGQASPLPRARRVTAKAVAAEEKEAPEILSPDLPRTGRRTAARKAAPAPTPPPVAPEEPKEGQASPLPRARRVTAKAVATEEEEAPEPEKADTPVARTGRKPRVLPTPVTRPTTRASRQAVEMAPTPASGTTGMKTKVVEVAPTPATGTTGLKTKKSSVKKTEEPLVATVNTGRSSRGRAAAKMTSLLQETVTAATANAGRRSTRLRGVGKMASLVHETEEPECKEANRDVQVGEDSDLCPIEPQAEIIESEKQITVSDIKKCQAIQGPLDSSPVEENVEGKVDTDSESQPLDSTPVEENAEGDSDLNMESEIVEEIQDPLDSAPEIKKCHEIQDPLDSAQVEENVEDGVVSESEIKVCQDVRVQEPLGSAPMQENVEDGVVSESEIKECQDVQVQEPLSSAPVHENVEGGVVSELEIKECQEVQVQEPLGLAPVHENVEDGVVSELEIKKCQVVQVGENSEDGVYSELDIKEFQEVQEPLESAPVKDNCKDGANSESDKDGANSESDIKEFQEVQEPLESAPVKDNCEDGANSESDIKEFQEVQEPLESAPVDENVECNGYPKPVSDDSPVWGLVDERSREGDVVEQSVDLDFHSDQTSFCDVSPVITKVFGDLSPINEAVEHSPPSDAVAKDEAEFSVIVPDTIEAVVDMVQTKEHFEEHVSEVVELKETEAANESDSIGFLSAFPATDVSEPFMVAEAEEHSDEQLEVSEVVEHFVELVAGSEAAVEQLVEHTAGRQFVEDVMIDSNTTEESDTAAASSPAILSPELIATAAVLSFAGAEESYQQSPVTESGELKSVSPLVAASSPPDPSTAVSPVKESTEVDLVLTGDVAEEPALVVDAMVVKAEDSSIAISLINEVAGELDLHQQELKAPANEVEKEPELSSDVDISLAGDLATDNDGGDCDDKENTDGEAKGKKPIRRHVVYSKLSMRKLKAILKERLAATAKNNTTGDGKKVEVKRTALRALDENQL